MTGPQITVTLDPAWDPLPMYPCPHGCGAQLGVSSSTSEGERGRCGQCQGRTVYRGGRLVTGLADDLAQVALAVRTWIEACAAGLRKLFQRIATCVPTAAPRPRMWPTARPSTLHAALAANPRPIRPYLDARPARTPATRRR